MATTATTASKCPVDHKAMSNGNGTNGFLSAAGLNPRNQMPELPQTPHASQRVSLPTNRSTSSIPKADVDNAAPGEITSSSPGYESKGNWEYPSPQQFYNALVRKGWETPEEHVEMMVDIHNWLNEAAWDQVMVWESEHGKNPSLAKFQGKPGILSPRARFFGLAGRIMPSRFDPTPPFDRHDWTIKRENGQEVRYVIDYYSGQTDENGNPVFHLDVRPALDSIGSIVDRVKMATSKTWEDFNAGA